MKWLVLAILAFAVSCLWWLDAEHGTGDSRQDAGSTLERGPEGLSLARAYLDEVAGRRTTLLTRSVDAARLPDDGVLFRIEPHAATPSWWAQMREKAHEHDHEHGQEPDAFVANQQAQEQAWVARGGRLVAASAGEGSSSTAEARVVLPLLPGVRQVHAVRGGLSEHELLDATPVVVAGDQVVIARHRVGRGDVWLLSCPEVFTNAQLTTADHAALLLALAGRERPVWFDEQVHGVAAESGFIALLRGWGLGPALVLGVLVVVVWFWRGRTLLGPLADPWRDLRAEAVEGVDALAGLYRRALSRRDLIELYRQRLLREVMLRTGQRPVAARATVDRLLSGARLPAGTLGESDFQRLVHLLNQAFRSLRDEHRRRRP